MIKEKMIKGAIIAASVAMLTSTVSAETITVGVGHQSTVTNTVPGGIIIEKLGLFEKYLPTTGKYDGVEYDLI
jgi:NitT/TauT family transport system substrate-binding protein